MSEAKIVTHACLDPNLMQYHTTYMLALGNEEFGSKGATHNLSPLGQLILDIPGIVEVRMHTYTLQVKKGVAFSWESIGPSIADILRDVYKSDRRLVFELKNIDQMETHPDDEAPSGVRVELNPTIGAEISGGTGEVKDNA